MTDLAHWHVSGSDLCRVFEALPGLVPRGSVLGLVGCAWPRAWPRDVREFLETHAVTLRQSIIDSLPDDFCRACFMPIDEPTMASLALFCQSHAEPEIAVHLIAVSDDTGLVEWYDLPDDPIAVDASIDETLVARFAKATGGRHEMARAGT